MHLHHALFTALLSAPSVHAAYKLQDSCIGPTFQNCFNFYSGPDPTNGFVK